MELPRVLKPWSASLDLFPREIVSALGPLVRRLDMLIGPLRAQGHRGEGDPDGYYGIERKGSYERLLLSEWLLAEEAPDEFARRVAMNELAFLKVARRQEVGARVSVVLFDAGPNQLGSPRIAHLAALIVLARRAAVANADFRWGVLQTPLDPLDEVVSAATVGRLLSARSPYEATEADAKEWTERIQTDFGGQDAWVVGGKRLASFTPLAFASRLEVCDPLEPEKRELLISTYDNGRSRRNVPLELPQDDMAARLLRDPFQSKAAEPRRARGRYGVPTSAPICARMGTRLIARSGTEHVAVYPVPNYVGDNVPKPKIYQSGGHMPIYAAAQLGKGIALVVGTEDPKVLRLERVGSQRGKFPVGTFRLPEEIELKTPAADDSLGCCLYLEETESKFRWLIQVNDALLMVRLTEDDGEPFPAVVDMNPLIAAGSRYASHFVAGARRREGLICLRVHDDGTRHVMQHFAGIERAFFGHTSYYNAESPYLLAYETLPGRWSVTDSVNTQEFRPAETDAVVGAVNIYRREDDGAGQYDPGLVVLDADRRRLSVIGKDWSFYVPRSSSDIRFVTVSTYAAELAYLTANGELVIYSLSEHQVLYRLETEVSV